MIGLRGALAYLELGGKPGRHQVCVERMVWTCGHQQVGKRKSSRQACHDSRPAKASALRISIRGRSMPSSIRSRRKVGTVYDGWLLWTSPASTDNAACPLMANLTIANRAMGLASLGAPVDVEDQFQFLSGIISRMSCGIMT